VKKTEMNRKTISSCHVLLVSLLKVCLYCGSHVSKLECSGYHEAGSEGSEGVFFRQHCSLKVLLRLLLLLLLLLFFSGVARVRRCAGAAPDAASVRYPD
jgi:hypothetical protein